MRLAKSLYDILRQIWYCYLSVKYGFCSCKSNIARPLVLHNPNHIRIGSDCYIMPLARFEAIRDYCGKEYDGELIIEDQVSIGQGAHIIASSELIIEKGATLSSYVFVSDCHHSYEDIEIPIMQQPLLVKPVHIGEGCLVGRGAAILAGASVGKYSVIGANSVVTSVIPDYCIAAGIPAKIIKKYDFEKRKWVKV